MSARIRHAVLAEFAVWAIELKLGSGSNVAVEYDARVPEPDTGRKRQVDVFVTGAVSGRDVRRIVEVRDRGRPVGPEFVDQVQGKATALRVHRATIVSAAGLTEGGRAKIEAHSQALDAFELRESDPARWPLRWPERRFPWFFNGTEGQVELEPFEYVDARTGVVQLHGHIGDIESPMMRAGLILLMSPTEALPGTPVELSAWLLGVESSAPVTVGPLVLDSVDIEGVQESREVFPRAVPHPRNRHPITYSRRP
ncbi:MAG: hypothetical protein R3C39_12175 [Dehalococcoidia bacterium]